MKKDLLHYYKNDFDSVNIEIIHNIIFEMMGQCTTYGNAHIIIEQEEEDPDSCRFLTVQFPPNEEVGDWNDGINVCCITSVVGDCEKGPIYEPFTNYMDACRWIAGFIREGDFTEIYVQYVWGNIRQEWRVNELKKVLFDMYKKSMYAQELYRDVLESENWKYD